MTMADLNGALEQQKKAGEVTWSGMLLRPSAGMRLMLLVVVGASAAWT